jgi:class 3 adenylate cyclase/tetratricopeptide (TPR) repeat protein
MEDVGASLGTPYGPSASYVARLVAERLSLGAITEAEASNFKGAVLLTDVVNFTGHVETITESGAAGLEDLAAALDGYFSTLVSAVHAHGGDILNVAGDGFLCLWSANDDDLEVALMRAVQGGLAVIDATSRPFGPEGRQFRTRIGVGAGSVVAAYVGGSRGNWRLMATGPAVFDVGNAEVAGTAGRVTLSQKARELIGHRCELEHGDSDLPTVRRIHNAIPVIPAPPRALVSDDLLRPMIPPPVFTTQMSMDANWTAELRQVTVVMASLSGVDHVHPTSLELGQATFNTFQETVDRFGGYSTVSIDNKGITSIGIFGLPPFAHEDDAARGVLSAQRLVDTLEADGTQVRAGVATGRAFCGVFGNDIRREYTVHGKVMNLASRLMVAAKSGTLVDHRAASAARGLISFEPEAPIAVKGLSEPVVPWRPTSSHSREHGSARVVVGREHERALLERALTDRRSLVVVEGEAGIGKSTLVHWAADAARRSGLTVLMAAADSLDTSTGYLAWRPVIESLADQSLIQEVIDRQPELARFVPLLAEVMPGQWGDPSFTDHLAGDVRSEMTRRLLTAMVGQAAQRAPTCLVIEDAHWMDGVSWALLLDIARLPSTMSIVVATRPFQESVPEEFTMLLGEERVEHLKLAGLGVANIDEVLALRLGVSEVPAMLTSFIGDRVSGNPFFCIELMNTLLENGNVVVDGEDVELIDFTDVQVPSTIEGVITARIDRLTASESMTLKTASVIGRVFREQTVREAFPISDNWVQVDEDLQRVAQVGLIGADPTAREVSYSFSHEITREVAYSLLTLAQRQPIHLAVVDWYERTYESRDPYLGLLAEHSIRAGADNRAIDYLEMAGNQALRGGAFTEAGTFFSKAADLDDACGAKAAPTRRAGWSKSLGAARYFLGNLAASRTAYERSLVLAGSPLPSSDLGLQLALARSTARQALHLVLPKAMQRTRLKQQVEIDQVVDCYRVLGQIYFLDHESTARLIHLTLAGLNIGERGDDSPALARILMNAGIGASLARLNGLADGYARRALEMVDSPRAREAGAYVWAIYTVLLAGRGKWDEAREANDRAVELVFEVGDLSYEAEVWRTRTTFELCAGNLEAAEVGWKKTRTLSEQSGNEQMHCWSLLDEALSSFGRGFINAADRALEESLAITTYDSDGSTIAEKHAASAAIRLRQGRFAEAVVAATNMISMVVDADPVAFPWPDYTAIAVETLLDVIHLEPSDCGLSRDELTVTASKGMKSIKRSARTFKWIEPRLALLEGILASVNGNRDKAAVAFDRSRELARTARQPFDEARALLAGAGVVDGRNAVADLKEAASVFVALGATPLAESSSEALAHFA